MYFGGCRDVKKKQDGRIAGGILLTRLEWGLRPPGKENMTEKFYTEREGNGLKEECGVFGMYDFDGKDVAGTIYYGLLALQHRVQ